jgi:hypothetical protein
MEVDPKGNRQPDCTKGWSHKPLMGRNSVNWIEEKLAVLCRVSEDIWADRTCGRWL